jgi:N6-L-threonylcarbamoyladenine synthase
MKDMYILGIESSCDETSASIVKNGCEEISTVISTQMDIHKAYGGVVPEIASRHHVEDVTMVIKETLTKANMKMEDIDAIGVTYGPGLVGALLVGVSAAKTIAYLKDKPLIGVNHMHGHISANYIENKEFEPPFMCLVVSGDIQILSMLKAIMNMKPTSRA